VVDLQIVNSMFVVENLFKMDGYQFMNDNRVPKSIIAQRNIVVPSPILTLLKHLGFDSATI
jgi:hypothetical protein